MDGSGNSRTKILEQLVKDCYRFNFTEEESLCYIKERAGGRGIKRSNFYAIKKRVNKNELNTAKSRIIYHTNAGLVVNHFKRMDEAEFLQSTLFRSLHNETQRPKDKQSPFAIVKLATAIMTNSQYMHMLNVASPVIDKMREYIDSIIQNKPKMPKNDYPENIPSAVTLPPDFLKNPSVSEWKAGNRVFSKTREAPPAELLEYEFERFPS